MEGIEGSGKTTQAARLARTLRARGYPVLLTREPGGTAMAERIRGVLLDGTAERMAPETEALLILAARRQHVAHVIQPALAQGTVVICDRFVDSTLAYQGYARGLDLPLLHTMNRWATNGIAPDLTVLFDLPVVTGLRRRHHDTAPQNRLDREAARFHRKVRTGFLALAKREPRRIKVVDASQRPQAIESDVDTLVSRRLATRRAVQRSSS